MNRVVRWLRWLFKQEDYRPREPEKPMDPLPPNTEQRSFTGQGVIVVPEEKVSEVPEEKATGDVVTPHDPRVHEIKKAIEKATEKDKRKK